MHASAPKSHIQGKNLCATHNAARDRNGPEARRAVSRFRKVTRILTMPMHAHRIHMAGRNSVSRQIPVRTEAAYHWQNTAVEKNVAFFRIPGVIHNYT